MHGDLSGLLARFNALPQESNHAPARRQYVISHDAFNEDAVSSLHGRQQRIVFRSFHLRLMIDTDVEKQIRVNRSPNLADFVQKPSPAADHAKHVVKLIVNLEPSPHIRKRPVQPQRKRLQLLHLR